MATQAIPDNASQGKPRQLDRQSGQNTDTTLTAQSLQESAVKLAKKVNGVGLLTNIQHQRESQTHQPTSLDGMLEGTRDRLTKSGTNSPSWPTSPRLKSPPPNTSRIANRRDSLEGNQSNTARRLAPVSAPDLAAVMLLPDSDKDVSQSSNSTTHARASARSANTSASGLETVVEGSAPTTPSSEPKGDPMAESYLSAPDLDTSTEKSSTASSIVLPMEAKDDLRTNRTTTKNDADLKVRAASTSRAHSNLAKRSFTNLAAGKKTVAEPVRTMTVETEPVAPGASIMDRRDTGSVRTKTSTETIRPKKEKKKSLRKPVQTATGTSKADIFEAKVANAVEEAETSDSDETFVYESNPPEPRSYRHHSRTPSATSLTSTHDHFRNSKHGIRNGSNVIAGKKSMKFSNSSHARETEDDSGRGGSRTVSSTPRHHHIGRHGRSNNNHTSLFDQDSPFGQAGLQGAPRAINTNLKDSRPNSPRLADGKMTSPRKYGGSAYDNNEDVADDERAPLMGTVRGSRTRHSKRPPGRSLRALEMGEDDEDRSCWSRCTSGVLLIFVLLVISSGLGLFAMAVNRPLLDVEIRKITNVLASEQELMLDLDVKAINPNLFAVMVTDLDVNLFAQSPYVGTSVGWQKQHSNQTDDLPVRKRSWFWPDPEPSHNGGVDEGTDPDDGEGVQKMLLGRVQVFDSPLTFEPAPLRHSVAFSDGEIRLAKPGNKTEVGGSDRWERVLQHDFDLIVRGVIKYQLPFSSKLRSAKIGGRKTVHPDGEDNGN